MNRQLFGSTLIKKWFPDFRNPNDIDYVVFDSEDAGTNQRFDGRIEEFHYLPMAPQNREMNPDELYTLKVSHANRDIHWSKTMSDIRFLQIKNCKLIPSFLDELRDFWNEVHGPNRRTSFMVGADDFFKDNVQRKIQHDEAHKLLNPDPSYLKIVDSENGVMPLKDKFYNDLTNQEQFDVAYEEAFVIALERYLDLPDKQAYHVAQRNLVTRLHPLWIADFVIENWNQMFWNPSFANKLYEQYKSLRKGFKL